MEKKSKYSETVRGEFVEKATSAGIDPDTAHTLAEYVVERSELSFRNGMKFAARRSGQAQTEEVAA